MGGWVDGHFDFFLAFYLNHLSPLQGYFLILAVVHHVVGDFGWGYIGHQHWSHRSSRT